MVPKTHYFFLMNRFLLLCVFFGLWVTAGFSQVDHWETAVYSSDNCRYFPGTSEPPADWMLPDFDASNWAFGSGGIGYGDGDDGTVIDPVVSVYIRYSFTIIDESVIEQAILHADYDDAFVAYLNGQEIARSNITGNPPAYSTHAIGLHEAGLYQGVDPEPFVLDEWTALLEDGTNVLAFQVHNYDGLLSSDLSSNFFLTLGVTDTSTDYGTPPDWFYPPLTEAFSTPLPIITINTNGQYIPDEPEIPAEMGIIWNEDGSLNASDAAPNEFLGPITIERRGQSSLFLFPKNGFGIETKDENGEDVDVSFLNFPEEEDWVLHGPYSDKTLLRNVLAMHLANGTGSYNSRTRFVELIINDQYEGLYVMMEKIKRDKNRVDIANLREEDISGDELTGGYVFKIDKGPANWLSQFPMMNHPENALLGFQYVSPNASKIMPEQEAYIQSYVDSFELALYDFDYVANGKRYNEFVDLESFADHFILKELSKDVDAYRISSYYYKEKDSDGGLLHAGPVWDFNIAYGNVDYCEGSDPAGWIYDVHCGTGNPFWWDRMLADPVFLQVLQCRWQELRSGPLLFNAIYGFVMDQAELLQPALDRNFTRWPVLGQYIWPNAQVFNTYEEEVDYLLDFIQHRLIWMDQHMPGLCIPSNVEEAGTDELGLNVFPVPFSDKLNVTLELPRKATVTIKIWDSLGRSMYHENLGVLSEGRQQQSISLDKLPNGIYWLEVKVGAIQSIQRIVRAN